MNFLLYILRFLFSLGDLNVRSPDQLSTLIMSCAISSFGDPFIFPQYGKLYFGQINPDCSFSSILPQNIYVIIYSFPSNCYKSDIALSIQQAGAIGLIFVLNNDNINKIITPKDYISGDQIWINVIGISNTNGKQFKKFSQYDIWIDYSLSVTKENSPTLTFVMNGNYSLDRSNIIILNDMNEQFNFTLNQFQLIMSYSNLYDEGVNENSDCGINNKYTDYCIPGSSYASGSQMLENTLKIVNYFNSLSGINGLAEFFSFANTLYIECEYNYSSACIESVFDNYHVKSSINSVEFILLFIYIIFHPFIYLTKFNIFGQNKLKEVIVLV